MNMAKDDVKKACVATKKAKSEYFAEAWRRHQDDGALDQQLRQPTAIPAAVSEKLAPVPDELNANKAKRGSFQKVLEVSCDKIADVRAVVGAVKKHLAVFNARVAEVKARCEEAVTVMITCRLKQRQCRMELALPS